MGWILINDLATLVSIVDLNTFLNLNSFFFNGSKFNNDGLFISCFVLQLRFLEM